MFIFFKSIENFDRIISWYFCYVFGLIKFIQKKMILTLGLIQAIRTVKAFYLPTVLIFLNKFFLRSKNIFEFSWFLRWDWKRQPNSKTVLPTHGLNHKNKTYIFEDFISQLMYQFHLEIFSIIWFNLLKHAPALRVSHTYLLSARYRLSIFSRSQKSRWPYFYFFEENWYSTRLKFIIIIIYALEIFYLMWFWQSKIYLKWNDFNAWVKTGNPNDVLVLPTYGYDQFK